jgi:hypothetical protein
VPVSGIKAGIGGLNTCKNGGVSPILPKWEVKELEVFCSQKLQPSEYRGAPKVEVEQGFQAPNLPKQTYKKHRFW